MFFYSKLQTILIIYGFFGLTSRAADCSWTNFSPSVPLRVESKERFNLKEVLAFSPGCQGEGWRAVFVKAAGDGVLRLRFNDQQVFPSTDVIVSSTSFYPNYIVLPGACLTLNSQEKQHVELIVEAFPNRSGVEIESIEAVVDPLCGPQNRDDN